MADVSRSVYLSKKLSGLIDDHTSSKHAYDGVFSSPPAPTKNKLSTSRIDDFREIFTPSSVSLGSSIPILDLPPVDLTGRALSGADYAGVFGGFADSDGIGPPPEEMIQLAKTMPKRDAHPSRSPVQMRRMPSKSQEFSFNNGNDQTSSLAQMRRVPSKSQEFSLSNGNAQTSSTAQARRVPSKSQEFSFSNGNDQTSSTAQARRMPSKSQEFSCNYGNDQTSNSAQVTGMPSKSQQFSSNYANDQRSTSAQTMRMPSKSKEFSRNYGNEQRSTPVQTMRMPSKSQEFPCNYDNDQRSTPAQTMRMPSKSREFLCNNGNDQASTPTQTMRMPSKSQEFPCNNGNDQASTPTQTMRMPSKSQEFPCNYGHGEKTSPVQTKRMPSKSQEFPSNHGNDQTSSSAHPRMESSKSQEFSRNLSNNHMSSSPLQAGMPYLRGDEISGDPLNDQVSESTLPHQTVDGVKHVSVSYHLTKQLSKDGTDGMTHIAHLHAVPGYTLLFDDEAGPVRKSGFDKAKRLSMDDADFSSDAGKVSKQGKHTRAVSDLGTNKQASDYDHGGGDNHFAASHDARQNRSMSVSNSPQSSGGSDYFKRAASRRPNGSKKIQQKNAVRDPFPLLELDVNSDAAVSAAAMKRAIEEAEEKIRWAKEFLMGLESIGFITPTLKDSFKVKATSDTYHSYEAYAPKQNGSLKVNATRQKKCINEDRVRRRNGSGVNSHANEAGREIPKDDLHRVAAQVETTMRSPSAPDTLEESPESVQYSDSVIDGEVVDNTNAHEELNLTEKSGKYEGVGEWEAAKHLSQIFTGVKNRLVSFISKQADVEKTVIQNEAQSKYESLEQERAYKVRNLDTVQDRAADLERVEEKVEMSHSTCSVVRDSAQESIGISVDMEILEAEVNKDNGSGATSSPDVEMLTSKQCGQSEPEEVVKYIEAEETENITNELNQDVHTEVKGELLQEVRVQNQEIFDATMQTEHESQMGPIELEERDENDETVNQVQGLEPVKERVIESIDNEAVNSRQVEGCNLKEIEIPKDAQTKQEDVGMVEETCMLEELCERVVEAEEIHAGGEDVEEVAGQDVTSEATEGLTEVFGDVSEHDEHLAAVDEATEQDKLFISKNEEASVPDETIQYAPSVRSPSEDKGKMTESAAVPFEPREDIEESKSVHRGSELLREGICEQPRCSIEVVDDDDSEIDEYLPANDDILEQDELISSTRNADATEHNNVGQYALNVDLPSQEESRTEATSTTFEPEGNIEKPRSVQMANDELSRGYKFVDSGSGSEVADESLEHDDYVPAADDVCEKDEHSCLNRNAEAYDQDENQYAQEVKVAAGEERMATDAGTSEFEETEQPSSTQKANELVGEQMTEKIFITAGDTLVLDETEKEIEEAHEVHRCTDDETTECDTVYKFEMKHCDEETRNFPTNIRPGNQDDESNVSTREANEASEQDVSSHDGELSHKRRRWFEKKEEVGELQRPGIFKEYEKVLEMDQENAEGFKAKDRVEISVEEIANESGEGVHMEQGDAGSGQDQEGEGLHSTEGTHRRRRWFENSGQKIQLRPSPFTGVGVTTEIDHEIAPEFKEEISSQSVVDQLVNERKDGAESADGMDSNMANDQVECRASTEAGHRRRRWFESKEKSGAAQRPGPTILENNEAAAELEEEMAMTADTAKHELRESSTSGDLASTNKREEHNKEREKEKERLVVERAIREVRQRAFAEARERAAAEARLKAAAASQDKQGKASSEAKPSSDKASMDAKLKLERAAVERATSEARERALQKSVSDKAAFKSFEKDPKNQCSGPSSSSGYSTSVSSTSDRSNGAVNESPQRRKAISERNKRTTERAAKALEEKNMRDVIAQKEQAERTRFANALDADVKRWSSGKEGNLRSLLSTLQYILSPDSGWQPIPLTDLVSTTAIRKAYKRAALCVHPDKLQQRGATIQQKYICEKVFDLLKDAWNKLNPEDR